MKLLENRKRRWSYPIAPAAALLALALPLTFAGTAVSAAPVTVQLLTSANFAVLAAAGVSNIPTSTISGDVGVTPTTGAAITGLTCAEVTGTIYSVDASPVLPCRQTNPGLLSTAMTHATAAYVDAAGRPFDTDYAAVDNPLGGKTLVAGVYRFGHAATANLIGNLTLNGDADAVWIFQATSDFVTSSSSTVTMTGGAQACNVFWQVSSSATLGSSSTLRGTVLANTSISVGTSATVEGRLLAGTQALSGAVTLDRDTITKPSTCVTQAQVNAATAAAAAATAAANAAAAATAAANQAAADAAAAEAIAATAAAAKVVADKAAADAKLAADAKAAADRAAATAAAAAARAAAATSAAAAKTAAVKAAAAAKVAASRAATAKKAALRVAAAKKLAQKRAAHGATSTHALPARRHAGFTG
jgi:hypothetical protein